VHVHDGAHDLLDHLLGSARVPGAHMLVVLVVDQVALLDVLHHSVLHAVEELHTVQDQNDVLVGVVAQNLDYLEEALLVVQVHAHLVELHCLHAQHRIVLQLLDLLDFALAPLRQFLVGFIFPVELQFVVQIGYFLKVFEHIFYISLFGLVFVHIFVFIFVFGVLCLSKLHHVLLLKGQKRIEFRLIRLAI